MHVGLLHGLVPGHPEENVRPRLEGARSPRSPASGLDYVALGHCHQLTEYRFDAGGAAAYCGALEGTRFGPGDLGRKGLLVVTLAPGSVTLEPMPFSRKTLVDETIDLDRESIKDAEALRAALLARAGSDVIARFTLVGHPRVHLGPRDVRRRAPGPVRGAQLVDRSSFEKSSLLRRIGAENTIRGFFVRRMRSAWRSSARSRSLRTRTATSTARSRSPSAR